MNFFALVLMIIFSYLFLYFLNLTGVPRFRCYLQVLRRESSIFYIDLFAAGINCSRCYSNPYDCYELVLIYRNEHTWYYYLQFPCLRQHISQSKQTTIIIVCREIYLLSLLIQSFLKFQHILASFDRKIFFKKKIIFAVIFWKSRQEYKYNSLLYGYKELN